MAFLYNVPSDLGTATQGVLHPRRADLVQTNQIKFEYSLVAPYNKIFVPFDEAKELATIMGKHEDLDEL